MFINGVIKQFFIRKSRLMKYIQSVIFVFSPNLAAYFARSSSNHSYGYAFSDDRTNYFTGLTENSEPL